MLQKDCMDIQYTILEVENCSIIFTANMDDIIFNTYCENERGTERDYNPRDGMSLLVFLQIYM